MTSCIIQDSFSEDDDRYRRSRRSYRRKRSSINPKVRFQDDNSSDSNEVYTLL